jgi:hypothetical protein
MPRIFISYRHADSKPYVGRLYDQLVTRFREQEVFRDIESIKAGEDFLQAINRAEGSCDALIAVIGPRWLDTRDALGRRRLADPNDTVRREIEAALSQGLRVVPVLVGGAKMPDRRQLPASLAALAGRKAIELSDERFKHDVDRLVEAVGGAYGEVRVALGESLALLARARLMGMRVLEVYLDGKPMGRFGSNEVRLGQEPPTRDPVPSPLAMRIRDGLHTIWVTARQLAGLSQSSKPLLFKLKAGQTAFFTVDEERREPAGPPRLVIRPLRPVVEP